MPPYVFLHFSKAAKHCWKEQQENKQNPLGSALENFDEISTE